MIRQFSLLLGSTILAGIPSLTAMAQEYSFSGAGAHGRGPAMLTPVESAGIHETRSGDECGLFHHKKATFTPYYAPLSPTPTFARWRTTHYAPHYVGYCPNRLFGPHLPRCGSNGSRCGFELGLDDHGSNGSGLGSYGPFTGAGRDDTTFWHMGGNGLVPYSVERHPHSGPPDIVDAIQSSRGRDGAGGF
jgi:hypothetical protein